VISAIFTVMLGPVELVEVAKIGRVALEMAGYSRPAWSAERTGGRMRFRHGLMAIVRRKLLTMFVAVCATTEKARWRRTTALPLKIVVPSCLVFPGAPNTSPPLIGAV